MCGAEDSYAEEKKYEIFYVKLSLQYHTNLLDLHCLTQTKLVSLHCVHWPNGLVRYVIPNFVLLISEWEVWVPTHNSRGRRCWRRYAFISANVIFQFESNLFSNQFHSLEKYTFAVNIYRMWDLAQCCFSILPDPPPLAMPLQMSRLSAEDRLSFFLQDSSSGFLFSLKFLKQLETSSWSSFRSSKDMNEVAREYFSCRFI